MSGRGCRQLHAPQRGAKPAPSRVAAAAACSRRLLPLLPHLRPLSCSRLAPTPLAAAAAARHSSGRGRGRTRMRSERERTWCVQAYCFLLAISVEPASQRSWDGGCALHTRSAAASGLPAPTSLGAGHPGLTAPLPAPCAVRRRSAVTCCSGCRMPRPLLLLPLLPLLHPVTPAAVPGAAAARRAEALFQAHRPPRSCSC